MNRENAIKLIPIIQAFADGKIIEYNNLQGIWISNIEIGFNDDYNRYRIKPEPKLVPFAFEDNLLFRDKWMRRKGSKINHLIRTNLIGGTYVIFNEFLGTKKVYFLELLNNYEFEDGSPCGKYINE